ncbi:VOC family protein [Nitratireductor aquimarinus]|uniref:VOC family protein n=1 Tax=Nitratireductor aquimarinus TaxID=889300 RepID=A0ABU4AIX4_9HYPH|nr:MULTISPECIES: VOC family protein [Alphaproteobacteria]MBY6023986.1 VOC family protein [Nitratireductor sp. DP7N14-4]MBN7759025.1 VOC family protein [Nitratireductor aquimarinus]MBN7763482.1 VOC family protein [Nitratireductor aquibiodomus]MBN7778752.1 VOC family protein [Nitratireductor pacificus]MBN7783075.1 VOC family protein [Nitratireductor pacificus]
MEPRISLITLGVDDLERAVAFYEAMGLERNRKMTGGVAFFQMGGMILALWPREELVADVGEENYRAAHEAAAGHSGVALAYNTRSEDDVIVVLNRAAKAGGRIVKPAAHASWGGFQGYFADTEGNLWEVAFNPDFPISDDGAISLPD